MPGWQGFRRRSSRSCCHCFSSQIVKYNTCTAKNNKYYKAKSCVTTPQVKKEHYSVPEPLCLPRHKPLSPQRYQLILGSLLPGIFL